MRCSQERYDAADLRLSVESAISPDYERTTLQDGRFMKVPERCAEPSGSPHRPGVRQSANPGVLNSLSGPDSRETYNGCSRVGESIKYPLGRFGTALAHLPDERTARERQPVTSGRPRPLDLWSSQADADRNRAIWSLAMHIVTLTNVAGLAEIDAALSDHVVWLDENRPGLDADWGHDLSLNATEGCGWSDCGV